MVKYPLDDAELAALFAELREETLRGAELLNTALEYDHDKYSASLRRQYALEIAIIARVSVFAKSEVVS